MTPNVHIEMRDFSRKLSEYIRFNRRDLAEILNWKMFAIAKRARELTPSASREEILRETGAEDIHKTSKRTGKTRRTGFQLKQGAANPFALMGYWAKKKGIKLSRDPAERAAEAKKFVGRRLSAINALKAGWNFPIRKFAQVLKQMVTLNGRAKQRGSASVAKQGWNPEAVVEYAVVEKKGGGIQIDPRVESALATAFREETASMGDYIAKKMQERLASMK